MTKTNKMRENIKLPLYQKKFGASIKTKIIGLGNLRLIYLDERENC